MIIDNIISFLVNRAWTVSNETPKFIELRPPANIDIQDDFRIYVPRDLEKSDAIPFLNNLLEIIGDFYSLSIEDLNVMLKFDNSVLKIRVHDEKTVEGKISLTRFEELVERIRQILSDTASFVIDRSVISTRVPEEVARYLNLCNFMQTEQGSFVAKIQLPSKEIVKESELFERGIIYSEEVNNKLFEVLSFVNDNILEGEVNVTEEYLIENESKINLKLYKDIKALFEKTDLKNIDFALHSKTASSSVINNTLTKQKIYKLTQFVEKIESHVFEVGVFIFTGKITTLKSKDPDGLKNSVVYVAIHDNLPLVVAANLDSEHYKAAIEAHKLKQNITITGQAKKTKTSAKFTEITNFQIED